MTKSTSKEKSILLADANGYGLFPLQNSTTSIKKQNWHQKYRWNGSATRQYSRRNWSNVSIVRIISYRNPVSFPCRSLSLARDFFAGKKSYPVNKVLAGWKQGFFNMMASGYIWWSTQNLKLPKKSERCWNNFVCCSYIARKVKYDEWILHFCWN